MSEERERLKGLLVRYALRENKVVLSDGSTSEYFVESRAVTLSSLGAFLAGRVFLELFEQEDLRAKAVGGMEGVGALASAIAAVSAMGQPEKRVDAFSIRRKQGANGHRLWVDGFRHKGPVIVLEEVATSGVATIETIRKVGEVGFIVQAVVALVDREEGAAGKVKSVCPFYTLYRAQELFDYKAELTDQKLSIIR